MGDVFRSQRQHKQALSVAVLGLGAGALACYRQPNDQFTFFELDADVVALARNPSLFTYLRDCTPKAPIIIGDARLQLQKQKDASYDIIAVDVFGSDSVPLHMLTTEAIALYRQKLKKNGIIVFQISNRHLDLTLPLASYANAQNLPYRHKRVMTIPNLAKELYAAHSYAVIAEQPDGLGRLILNDPSWQKKTAPLIRIWNDDYANILAPLLIRYVDRIAPRYSSAVRRRFAHEQ